MTEQTGPSNSQAEEVVEQVLGLAQGDGEMSAAIAGQQAGTGPDVGAGQFQVAATLAGLLTVPAAVDVAAVAMPFDLRFRDIGDEMVLEAAGGFEVGRAAMGTLCGMDVLLHERQARRWLVPDITGVLALLRARAGGWRAALCG